MSAALSNRWMKVNEKDMEILKKGIDEIVIMKQKIESHNDGIKSIVDSLYEKTKVPKNIIKKVANIEYKSSMDKLIEEHECIKDLWQSL